MKTLPKYWLAIAVGMVPGVAFTVFTNGWPLPMFLAALVLISVASVSILTYKITHNAKL